MKVLQKNMGALVDMCLQVRCTRLLLPCKSLVPRDLMHSK